MIGVEECLDWQKVVGYGWRSLAEAATFRCKGIGSSPHVRRLAAQKTETKVACSVLNQMASLDVLALHRIR